MIKNWYNPPASLRSKLFWAWNGTVRKERIMQQLRCMKNMQLGGFYIHSRTGLQTAYLSDEWFDLVRFTLQEAAKLGLEGAFYDEDRWPSGGSGGEIARQDPALCGMVLKMYPQPAPAAGELVHTMQLDGQELSFYAVKHTPGEWFNNSCYPDVLNPESGKSFLRMTHEKYLASCGDFRQIPVKEIFCDEPFFGVTSGVPWTKDFPELYQKRFQEPIWDKLPGLFVDLPDNAHCEVRWKYRVLAAELFCQNFLRQVAQWCEAHHLQLTGHLLGEDALATQALSCGSNMAALAEFSIPGIDYLTGQRRHIATVKQLASVARQCGKKDRLAEIYGCTGWEFTLYDQKAVGDMLFALGVNKHCLHLGWYDSTGERKRDYPGSIGWHSTWKEEYFRLEDHFGRLHAVFAECREVRNILLINPVESIYLLLNEKFADSFAGDFLENSRNLVIDTLLNSNLDFDLGDEALIARLGRVEDDRFIVGGAAYKAVVLPSMLNLRSSTLALLEKFAAAGGVVVCCGTPAQYVDGVRCRELRLPGVRCRADELTGLLEKFRLVSFSDPDGREVTGLLHNVLEHENGYFVFLHNSGYSLEQQADATHWRGAPIAERRKAADKVKISLKGVSSPAQVWDSCSGNITAAPELLSLQPSESRLLFFERTLESESYPEPEKVAVEKVILNGKMPVTLNEPNVLLLDRAQYVDENLTVQDAVDLRRLDVMLRSKHALPPRHIPSRQPWRSPEHGQTVPVTLRFEFFVDVMPDKPVIFAGEDAAAEIRCNDVLLAATSFKWFDEALSFHQVENLRLGYNIIEYRTAIHLHQTLENCFLLGDFGVQICGMELHITDKVRTLQPGSWTEQGLPFYAGAVDYHCHVPAGSGRCIGNQLACSYAVIVEEKERFFRSLSGLFIPDELEDFTLRLYGSCRNSQGPFHICQQLRYCNPSSFVPLREEFHPHWQLEKYGIF